MIIVELCGSKAHKVKLRGGGQWTTVIITRVGGQRHAVNVGMIIPSLFPAPIEAITLSSCDNITFLCHMGCEVTQIPNEH